MRGLLIAGFTFALIALSCKNDQQNAHKPSAADQLVANLRAGVNAHPDSMQLRMALVDALDSLQRFHEAITEMNTVLKKDSVNNSLWSRHALLLERSGDTTGAIASYIRSINIYPDIVTQLYLANILAERKDDRALMLVNQVSQVQFDDETLASCDFIAGVYQARKGNTRLALELFDRCIGHNVKFMEAYMEKGFIHFEQKKFDEALGIFALAGKVSPVYADAFYWQGKTLEALGRAQEAIGMYDQALRLDPDLKEASAALARLSGQQG